MILGIDEVGRGPWAGPLVVGAVVLPEGLEIPGLTDSKKLSEKRRIELDSQIKASALGWGLGWVSAEEIDEVGLSGALRLATVRAVQSVDTPYHEIVIDGTVNFLKDTSKGEYVQTMPKADFLIPAVSAASIIAKVARDTYMKQQDALFPEYGFATNVGYGTTVHARALEVHGVTSLHRKSFAPIARMLQNDTGNSLPPEKMNTPNSKGALAEGRVCEWLSENGHTIIERNWKTRWCEIDVITETKSTRYFVEVKYRSSSSQGGGVAAITPKKLKQMTFSAELYNSRFPTSNDTLLAVAAVQAGGAITLTELS